jgi:hypothetical protein
MAREERTVADGIYLLRNSYSGNYAGVMSSHEDMPVIATTNGYQQKEFTHVRGNKEIF